jgi:hypothetical protein
MSQTGSFSSGGMPKNPTFSTLVVTTALQLNVGAVFDLYNTADKTTNFESLREDFSGNVARIFTRAGGTGVVRGISIASGTYAGSSGIVTSFTVNSTFNQSGTAGYTLADFNAMESATGSGTKLLQRWAVGGTAKAQVNTNGALWADIVYCTNVIGFSTSIGGSGDLTLYRDAAYTLALRNGTNAQTDRNYETYTDGSNYSRMYRSWLAGFAYFGTQAAGTGTRRPLIVQHFQTTVGALPAAATAGAGSRCHVSDALGPVFGAAVVGGGAVSVPVYSDGAVWLVG